MEEGTRKNSNGLVAGVLIGVTIGTLLISMYVGF
jgi:F0F1-type ATP synthase assembly protein I